MRGANRPAPQVASGQRLDVGDRQLAGNHGDRDREFAGGRPGPQRGHQRPGSGGFLGGAEDQDGNVLVLVDLLQDGVDLLALRITSSIGTMSRPSLLSLRRNKRNRALALVVCSSSWAWRTASQTWVSGSIT